MVKPEETKGTKVVLDEYLGLVREQIFRRAQELAAQDEPINVTHVARAIEEHNGNRIQDTKSLGDYFPPVVFLSAMLTVIFAGLGLWALLGTAEVGQKLGGQGFLDIAKIFAGAIVGSATAVSVTKRTKS